MKRNTINHLHWKENKNFRHSVVIFKSRAEEREDVNTERKDIEASNGDHAPSAKRGCLCCKCPALTRSNFVSSSTVAEDQIPTCKICYETTGVFISPCNCSGSMKYIHLHCLNRWRQRQLISEHGDITKCRDCQADLRIQYPCCIKLLGHSLSTCVLTTILFACWVLLAGVLMKALGFEGIKVDITERNTIDTLYPEGDLSHGAWSCDLNLLIGGIMMNGVIGLLFLSVRIIARCYYLAPCPVLCCVAFTCAMQHSKSSSSCSGCATVSRITAISMIFLGFLGSFYEFYNVCYYLVDRLLQHAFKSYLIERVTPDASSEPTAEQLLEA